MTPCNSCSQSDGHKGSNTTVSWYTGHLNICSQCPQNSLQIPTCECKSYVLQTKKRPLEYGPRESGKKNGGLKQEPPCEVVRTRFVSLTHSYTQCSKWQADWQALPPSLTTRHIHATPPSYGLKKEDWGERKLHCCPAEDISIHIEDRHHVEGQLGQQPSHVVRGQGLKPDDSCSENYCWNRHGCIGQSCSVGTINCVILTRHQNHGHYGYTLFEYRWLSSYVTRTYLNTDLHK